MGKASQPGKSSQPKARSQQPHQPHAVSRTNVTVAKKASNVTPLAAQAHEVNNSGGGHAGDTSAPANPVSLTFVPGRGEGEGDHDHDGGRGSLTLVTPRVSTRPSRAHQDRTSQGHHGPHQRRKSHRGRGRFIIKNLWDVCCEEIETEIKEVDAILKKMGLPTVNYSKRKSYDITDYTAAPKLDTCKSKDFLDFYVFPSLLPAIQALIQFARVNRVFQCRFCTFNAIDYLVEYLYNNNPRYPERVQNPTPIFEIPFCKAWLEKHPRTPPPKWMLMNSEDAAVIIQRAIRGYMVRCRPAVMEMRQFWKDYRRDLEQERAIEETVSKLTSPTKMLPDYGDFDDDSDGDHPESPIHPTSVSHHSDNCIHCATFRTFLTQLPDEILKSYHQKARPSDAVTEADPANDRSSSIGGDSEKTNNFDNNNALSPEETKTTGGKLSAVPEASKESATEDRSRIESKSTPGAASVAAKSRKKKQ